MKTTLTNHQAAELLVADPNAKWTRSGALAVVEYLQSVQDELGTQIEFDRVAIRCDYAEYASGLEAATDYGFTSNETDEDQLEQDALEWLQDRTQVIEFDGGVVVQNF